MKIEMPGGSLLAVPAESPLEGTLRPPRDKSISHRALILSLLADGQSRIEGLLESEDVKATARACRQLGSQHTVSGGRLLVEGAGRYGLTAPEGVLDMGNSGTAMRLLAGVLSTQKFDSVLIGDESLSLRPMGRIIEPLTQMGASIAASGNGTPPLRIAGGRVLRGIRYGSPVASAQVKSCVLLAGLGATGETEVFEPVPSRDHTERMLESFGAGNEGKAWVRGGTRLHGREVAIPADISSAAFFIVAACLVPDSRLLLRDVGLNPTRDGVLEALKKMGADIEIQAPRTLGGEPVGDILVRWRPGLTCVEIGGGMIPRLIDELPIIMVTACVALGVTRIRDARELRVKESDRIAVMARGLREAGVRVREHDDGIEIEGRTGFRPRGRTIELDAGGDHRCAMSFAVLALALQDPVRIRGAENINTSYPGFVDDMAAVGAGVSAGEGRADGS